MEKPEAVIRKLSVGIDYKNCMVYIIGQKVLNNEYEIALIKQIEKTGKINIYIMNELSQVLLWKEFSETVPVSIEYYTENEGNK